MMTMKKVLFFLLSGICIATTQGKAGTVNLDCISDTKKYLGEIDNVHTPPDMTYDEKCDLHYQSTSPNCGAGCTASVVSSSDADPTGPERAIPATPTERRLHAFTPTEDEAPQTYAPAYQPQEEQRQNFQRSVTQGEEPEVPTDPTRDLRLAPMNQDSLEE